MIRTRALPLIAVVGLVVLVASSCLVVEEEVVIPVDLAQAHDVNNAGLVVGSKWPTSPLQIGVDRAYSHDLDSGATTDLGTLGGTTSVAVGVNEGGEIVGFSALASGQQRAFRYDAGSGMVDLGTLAPAATTPSSQANDINASGVVVGSSNLETGAVDASHAFVFDPAAGVMTDLGTLGGTSSGANAINDAGIVVGWSDIAGDSTTHAFAYDPSTDVMTDLGTLGSGSSASDVNEGGLVVGSIGFPDPNCEGCVYLRPFVVDLTTGEMTELATAQHYESAFATAINEEGVVVGELYSRWTCSHCHRPSEAVAWELGTSGVYTIAGRDHSASAINDDGLTVGTGYDTQSEWAAIPFIFRSRVTLEPDE